MDNFPLFNLLNELTQQGHIKNTLIQIKSKRDLDIVVSTDEGYQEFTRGVIEANLYTKKEFAVKGMKQRGKSILYLTNNGETIKIDVISQEELAKMEEDIVKY